jgi:peroxiredoxin
MAKVKLNTLAPEFILDDFQGNEIRLSDYRDRENILLVFNRGFI